MSDADPATGEWPDADEHAAVGESVRRRPRLDRADVVDVIQAVEIELGDESRAYPRADHLDAEPPANVVGKVLGMLADSPETVADLYSVPEACRLDVERWGSTDNRIRWLVRWADA